MNKSALSAALLLLGVLLSGCPIYDGDDVECFNDLDCAYGSVCDGHTNSCVSLTTSSEQACQQPSDCRNNETCSRSGSCVAGDCHFASVGCVSGYECSSASGRWECVPEGAGNPNGGAPSSSAGAPTNDESGGEPTTNGGAAAAAGAAG